MSSPIPADHISNTNPLAGSHPLAGPAEAELLELHSKLAFHGRRLFRHEVGAGGMPPYGGCVDGQAVFTKRHLAAAWIEA